MNREQKCPVGSRWRRNGRVVKVIARNPFGKLELIEEGKPIFIDMPQRNLLATHERLEDQTA